MAERFPASDPQALSGSGGHRPDWSDVTFDHGAAQSLASALRHAALWTEQLAEVRHRTMRWALEDAAGPWADQLETAVAQQGSECRSIADGLRRDAGRLEDASLLAITEQARRDRSRAEAMTAHVSPADVAPLPVAGPTD